MCFNYNRLHIITNMKDTINILQFHFMNVLTWKSRQKPVFDFIVGMVSMFMWKL